MDLDLITNNIWSFSASNMVEPFGHLVFKLDGRIGGYLHPNECSWKFENNQIFLLNAYNNPTSVFDCSNFNFDHWTGQVLDRNCKHSHVLSRNVSNPVVLTYDSRVAEIARNGNFYLSHFKRRDNVYKEGQKFWVYPDAYIEPTACLPSGCLYEMGAFSYQVGHSSANLKVGRYSSIANGLRCMGNAHPINWLTSSPVSYAQHHYNLFSELGIENPPAKSNFKENQNNIITIGNDVWIGEDCLLKPGVKINDGAIVAARSVVTKDVPPYAVVAGAPARIVKFRFADPTIIKLLDLKWWAYDLSNTMFDWSDVDNALEVLISALSDNNLKRLHSRNKNWSIELIGLKIINL